MEFKGTKGVFIDGTTHWKVGKRVTNSVEGYEIHWTDDGECITDHVYTLKDSKLIAMSPELLKQLVNSTIMLEIIFKTNNIIDNSRVLKIISESKQAIEKALK